MTALVFAGLIGGGVFWMYSRDLPSYDMLKQYSPKTISRVYSGQGRLIDEFADQRRIFVQIDDIPPIVKEAFVSAEDQNFYSHRGYDVTGIAAALLTFVKSGFHDLRGGSTITQQVTKNLLLDGSRSIERKVKEVVLASRLEQALTKDQILEIYLNEIFLGANSYGVAAAAQTYFNKPLSALSPGEAAYLASLPKKPSELNPVRNYAAAVERRNYVLRRLYEDGHITEAQMKEEQAASLKTVQNGDYPPFRATLPPRDYFTDEIRRQLSRSFGSDEFYGGGLTIRATINPDMQAVAAKALQDGLEKYDRGLGIWHGTGVTIAADKLKSEDDWRAALAEVPTDKAPRDVPDWYPAVVLSLNDKAADVGILNQPGTGSIPVADMTWARKEGSRGGRARKPSDLLSVGDVVMVKRLTADDGSFKGWSLRQVPTIEGSFMAMDVNTGRVIAMQGGFSYQVSAFNRATQAMRQPGSNFKPFVYAAALDSGYTPETIVVDAPIEVNTPQGLWTPKNDNNSFYGPVPMRVGLEQSRNLMTIRIAQDIGMERVARYAERFGVYDDLQPYLANAIGSQETTMFRLVAAYAMFANGGHRVDPTLVDRVQDRWGRTIYRHDDRDCEDCRTENIAKGLGPRIVAQEEQVIDPITAYQVVSLMQGVMQRGTGRGITLPVPVAGKTGTTNDAKDVWFTGYTSNIVASCHIGYDQPKTLGRSAFGATLCGPVFQQFMTQAIKVYGGSQFKVPPGGYWAKFDRYSGKRLSDDAVGDNVQAEYMRVGQDWHDGEVVDGGFAMGQNLPLIQQDQIGSEDEQVTTSTGETKAIPKKADFGTLSSGGLY